MSPTSYQAAPPRGTLLSEPTESRKRLVPQTYRNIRGQRIAAHLASRTTSEPLTPNALPARARPSRSEAASAWPGSHAAAALRTVMDHVDRVPRRVPQLFIHSGLRRGQAGLEQEIELQH